MKLGDVSAASIERPQAKVEGAEVDKTIEILRKYGISEPLSAIEHIERGTMLASADFSAFNIAAIAARAVLRHLDGQPVPKEITVPAELIDRSNCGRFKLPFAERACPAWQEIVR